MLFIVQSGGSDALLLPDEHLVHYGALPGVDTPAVRRRGGDPGAVADGFLDHAAVPPAEDERAHDDGGGHA